MFSSQKIKEEVTLDLVRIDVDRERVPQSNQLKIEKTPSKWKCQAEIIRLPKLSEQQLPVILISERLVFEEKGLLFSCMPL